MTGDVKVGQFPKGPSLYRGPAATRAGSTSHECLLLFCKNILTLPEAQPFVLLHPFCPAFRSRPLDLATQSFLFFSEALSHPPGPCLPRFRTCLYQTGAKPRIRGPGGGLSYETTCDMTTQAVVFFSEAAPAGLGFLDGVVHTSLSTPAPKWS